jgi:hypothetical protein
LEKTVSDLVARFEFFETNSPAFQNSTQTNFNGNFNSFELQKAVEEALLKEKKKNNLVLVGLPEKTAGGLPIDESEIVKSIVDELKLGNDAVLKVFRHGQERADGKPRITKIEFCNSSKRRDFLSKYKDVACNNEITKNSFVRPDLTPSELAADKLLRGELKKQRASGMKVYIKKGRIITDNRGATTGTGTFNYNVNNGTDY